MASAVRPRGKHRRRASAAARTGAALLGAALLSAAGYMAFSLAGPQATHLVRATAFGRSAPGGTGLADRLAAEGGASSAPAGTPLRGPSARPTPPAALSAPRPAPTADPASPQAPQPSQTPAAPPAPDGGPSATPAGSPQPSDTPAVRQPPQASSPAAAAPAAEPAPAAASAGYVLPLASGAVSTPYGATGTMWASGRNHGCDFDAATGTDVRSVGSGTVVRAGWDGAYGNDVLIRMDDGRYTLYAQLSSVAVSAGDQVTAGRVIGRSGESGRVTGPHLHFEVRTTPDYGSDVDPVAYLRGHGVAI